MKLLKNTFKLLSTIQGAIIISGLIVGLSIFLTTLIFFGGDNNRQKLSVKNPALNKQNQLSAQQVQQMQQQRALLQTQQAPTPSTATTTTPKAPVKK